MTATGSESDQTADKILDGGTTGTGDDGSLDGVHTKTLLTKMSNRSAYGIEDMQTLLWWLLIVFLSTFFLSTSVGAEEREMPGDSCEGQVTFPPVQIVGDRTFFPEGTITIAPRESPIPILFFARGRDAFLCARPLGWDVRVWRSGWKRVQSRDLQWK